MFLSQSLLKELLLLDDGCLGAVSVFKLMITDALMLK